MQLIFEFLQGPEGAPASASVPEGNAQASWVTYVNGFHTKTNWLEYGFSWEIAQGLVMLAI